MSESEELVEAAQAPAAGPAPAAPAVAATPAAEKARGGGPPALRTDARAPLPHRQGPDEDSRFAAT